jgi:uncharacterized protein DUF1800
LPALLCGMVERSKASEVWSMRVPLCPRDMSRSAGSRSRDIAAPRSLPVFRGTFGHVQAERLLWRAGFGPRPGEAKRLAKKGLVGAVRSLTRPGPDRLTGPDPVDDRSQAIAPADAFGHDHLWWLDRMVRSNRPLVERMTLIWHDWFATSNDSVGSQHEMLAQNRLFRQRWLGSFRELLLDVTKDPAMLVWLSGDRNTRRSPNENYARELMELFTLGAGRGYTEDDVREQARALTGWRNDYVAGAGRVNYRFDPTQHDTGSKTVFGQTGAWNWEDACRLCVENPQHAPFFIGKLWGYFIPTPPSPATQRGLERLYRAGYKVRPVVEAILTHPDLYRGPRMVKPPVVHTAGLLRYLGRGIDNAQWPRLGQQAGQRLFYPPDVGGWDDSRWLDTSTFRGRWFLAGWVLRPFALEERTPVPVEAKELVDRALAFFGKPALTYKTRRSLLIFARRSLADASDSYKQQTYGAQIENALRQLIATCPELQTC